jgi:glutaminyl-tRNA synthetase
VGEDPADGIKPKGVIQWVCAGRARRATLRLYDRLFRDPAPDRGENDFMALLNPDSLTIVEDALVEPALAQAEAGERVQFEREGYFIADALDHSPEQPVFNLTIGLRDVWENSGGGR